MNPRKNGILSLLLVLLCSVLVLAGCGTPAAPATPATPGGDAGSAGEPINVGLNLELTGSSAEFGLSGQNGMKLAFDKVNAEGGVLDGRLFNYISADNKSEAGEATSATTRLVGEDVIAILGPMTTAAVLGSIQIVTDNNVVLITPSGTNARLTVNEDGTVNPWIFRACFIDPFQGEVAANFAIDALGAETAAIAYDIVGDYSGGLAENFKRTFEAAGKTVVREEQFSAGDVDFRPIIENIKSAEPDVIFVPAYYTDDAHFVLQARDAGFTGPIMGGDGWGSGDMVGIAGADNMNNTYCVDFVYIDDPSLQDFVNEYQTAYGRAPDGFSVLGYETASMLIEAVKNAGSTEPEAVRSALENLGEFASISGVMTFDPETHNPAKNAVILEFVNGVREFKQIVAPK
ncbi:MAG: ABC transporter substrate-binding protein [Gracilibacteraceae bacterium]|jgi:branched-chain amino acid transport system substrate-binding protein|nr:ABC transporter substrate-binding protein [Gracilibacteraceae bacterium]